MLFEFIIGNIGLNYIFYRLINGKVRIVILNFCNIAYYRIKLAKAVRFFDGKVID